MNLNVNTIFVSSVGIVQANQFLKPALEVSNKFIEQVLKKTTLDPLYPVIQTENMIWDEKLVDFNNFVLESTSKLLDKQGYDVSRIRLTINDMWCQKHMKTSGHERHVHNNGAVMSAFYMLECPQNSSHLLLYDPRPGKEYGFVLPEKNEKQLTEASNIINYGPSEGELILANSYIPHGFTRNASDKPFMFLHINIYAEFVATQTIDTKLNTFSNKAIVV